MPLPKERHRRIPFLWMRLQFTHLHMAISCGNKPVVNGIATDITVCSQSKRILYSLSKAEIGIMKLKSHSYYSTSFIKYQGLLNAGNKKVCYIGGWAHKKDTEIRCLFCRYPLVILIWCAKWEQIRTSMFRHIK